jgi:hypothetical protein
MPSEECRAVEELLFKFFQAAELDKTTEVIYSHGALIIDMPPEAHVKKICSSSFMLRSLIGADWVDS